MNIEELKIKMLAACEATAEAEKKFREAKRNLNAAKDTFNMAARALTTAAGQQEEAMYAYVNALLRSDV